MHVQEIDQVLEKNHWEPFVLTSALIQRMGVNNSQVKLRVVFDSAAQTESSSGHMPLHEQSAVCFACAQRDRLNNSRPHNASS
jgi:hypothetical protein